MVAASVRPTNVMAMMTVGTTLMKLIVVSFWNHHYPFTVLVPHLYAFWELLQIEALANMDIL